MDNLYESPSMIPVHKIMYIKQVPFLRRSKKQKTKKKPKT